MWGSQLYGSQLAMPQHRKCACRYRYHDIVLVVVYDKRFGDWLAVHERLKKAYTPLFRQVVYTGFMFQVRQVQHADQKDMQCAAVAWVETVLPRIIVYPVTRSPG